MCNPYFNFNELFRFSGNYEDVFCENDHYLYVCAETFNYVWFLAVKEYHKLDNGNYLSFEWAGADMEYLKTLEYAPYDIATDIMTIELQNTCNYLKEEEAEEYEEYEEWLDYASCFWEEEYQTWREEWEGVTA